MKKIIAFLMMILIIASSTMYANAESNYYDALIQRGYSQEYLDTLTDNFIHKLYVATDGCYISQMSTETVELKNENSNIETYGTISPNSMKLSITTTEVCKKDTNKVALLFVVIEWEWFDGKPVIRLNDPITVNWDSNLFYLMEDGFISEDTWALKGVDYWVVSETYMAPAEANQGGIGYYTALTKDPNFSTCVGGHTLIILEPCFEMYSGNKNGTSINVNYTHNRTIIVPTPSFSKEGTSVGVATLLLCDKISATTNYRFNK